LFSRALFETRSEPIQGSRYRLRLIIGSLPSYSRVSIGWFSLSPELPCADRSGVETVFFTILSSLIPSSSSTR
ncbi:MAG: hypothetical protein VBE63_20200, partial [Lamprobacter sp.]|uniref:hypothetical protein n=1 Tax=Lamprobacter sp. TaxID=3100796 RepID=UPI002B258C06